MTYWEWHSSVEALSLEVQLLVMPQQKDQITGNDGKNLIKTKICIYYIELLTTDEKRLATNMYSGFEQPSLSSIRIYYQRIICSFSGTSV